MTRIEIKFNSLIISIITAQLKLDDIMQEWNKNEPESKGKRLYEDIDPEERDKILTEMDKLITMQRELTILQINLAKFITTNKDKIEFKE
jgi:hypothetical protein